MLCGWFQVCRHWSRTIWNILYFVPMSISLNLRAVYRWNHFKVSPASCWCAVFWHCAESFRDVDKAHTRDSWFCQLRMPSPIGELLVWMCSTIPTLNQVKSFGYMHIDFPSFVYPHTYASSHTYCESTLCTCCAAALFLTSPCPIFYVKCLLACVPVRAGIFKFMFWIPKSQHHTMHYRKSSRHQVHWQA